MIIFKLLNIFFSRFFCKKQNDLIEVVSDKFCPCCNRSINEFLEEVKNVPRCPLCRCTPRYRGLALMFFRRGFINKFKNVLDIAPLRVFKKLIKEDSNIQYVSVDLSSPEADIHADLTSLPFSSNSFDLVICSHVLEHISDDKKAINEIYRVLRPGGVAIIIVPLSQNIDTYENFNIVSSEDRLKVFGQRDHVRKCGKDYYKRLQECGFVIREVSLTQGFSNEEIVYYGLVQGEPIFICYK